MTVWTVTFTRNGKSYDKSFPAWLSMMIWIDENKDIEVINYK